MKAWRAWFAIGAAFLGCSSSNASGGDCGKVAPCGGDLVGTWKIIGSCADVSSAPAANSVCASETISVSSFSASGTVTFDSNMTYAFSASESASDTITVPMSCLSTGKVTVTCDDLTTVVNGVFSDAGTTCTASGSNCNCDVTVSGLTDEETGTYTLSGNTFSTTPSTSTATGGGAGYCVQGNTLHITLMAMGNAAGTPTADFVATRE